MRNIAFVIESLNIGGAEKSLINLLQVLDYSRYKVSLIVFKANGYFRHLVPASVEIIQLEYPKMTLLDRAKFLFQRKTKREYHHAQIYWNIVKNKFKEISLIQKYDVAIAYNQGFATYFTADYIPANKKFSWLNTDYSKAGYNIEYDYPIYKKFNSIVTVSPETKTVMDAQLESINETLHVTIIRDIIDSELLAQQAKLEPPHIFDKNTINIVSVGRLAEVKGFYLAVEACKILMEKGHSIHWYLVGEGQERRKLQVLIQKYKLGDNFTLVGEDPNPYRYMARADIYVQTSLFEGLGLTVIEAACLCKPIVCTNFPSSYGILDNEKTGLIVPMDAGKIALSIERLIDDKALRTRLIQNLSFGENERKMISLLRINSLLSA